METSLDTLDTGVSVCIVNWEGVRYLPDTLDAVLAQGHPVAEVLLVDNDSHDASLELVAKRFPSVRVVRLSRNRGPGAARNAGYRAARRDRILFVDNDVVLGPDCVARLQDVLEREPRAAVAMPRLIHADRPDVIQADGADCHYLGLMTLHHASQSARATGNNVRPIGSLVSAAFLVDRSRLGTADPFDERFFIYFEDNDFGFRTRSRGHQILAVPVAYGLHREGTPGLSLRHGGSPSSARLHLLIRNRWQLLLKDYELRTLLILAPMLLLYEGFQLAGVIAKGRLSEWAASVRWIARHWRAILAERARVQEGRRLPDRRILQGGQVPFHEALLSTPFERAACRALNRLACAYWAVARRAL